MPDYRYDAVQGRYLAPNGKPVPETTVRRAVDAVLDRGSARMRLLSTRLQAGGISLNDWEQGMLAEIKQTHTQAALAAKGGRAQMSRADYGALGARIREQYGYVRDFALDLQRGKQPRDGRLLARTALYAEAGRTTYYATLTREAARHGVQEGRRVLNPADHCAGCVREAARGWTPLEDLAPIGSQECRARCRCRIEDRPAGTA